MYDVLPHIIVSFLVVVDMCKSSFATEETLFGIHKVDSVVLRIMIQQDNCVCRVSIDNQIEPVSIGLRKYDGLTSSAPVDNRCGLAVDINHVPNMSTGYETSPIEYVSNVNYRNLLLLQNCTLQFVSRIINGNFTRGYCMSIGRGKMACNIPLMQFVCTVGFHWLLFNVKFSIYHA
jgi:hypothetical protein